MSGVAIGWDQTDPADSKNLGLGAGDIRSLKTNLQGGLNAEHVWPDTGGTTGAHRKGSAVAFYGAASAVSSADTEGRLMLTSDTSRLYHVASAVTHLVGSRQIVEAAYVINDRLAPSTYTSTVTQGWAMECGVGRIPVGSSSTAITLQHTYVKAMAQFGPMGEYTATWATYRPGTPNPSTSALFAGATMTVYSINTSGAQEALNSGQTLDFTYMVMGFRAL